jgi:uncharacterized protein YggE
MNKMKYVLIPILALGLVLSACAPTSQPPSLTVTGSGTVSLPPDVAYIYVGIHTDDPDLANAVSKNNTQTQALVDALKNSGIDSKDIQTSNFNVYFNNNGGIDKANGQVISNGYYSVDNTVYVTIRDLTTLGKMLDTAVKSGANNINSISFDVADKTTALTEARKKAMDNAVSLASEMAKNAGVKLGKIESISYTDYSPYPYYGMGGGGAAAAPNASVPIQPGQTQISATVTVTYIIQ